MMAKFTGNHYIWWLKPWFPVDFPLTQSIDSWWNHHFPMVSFWGSHHCSLFFGTHRRTQPACGGSPRIVGESSFSVRGRRFSLGKSLENHRNIWDKLGKSGINWRILEVYRLFDVHYTCACIIIYYDHGDTWGISYGKVSGKLLPFLLPQRWQYTPDPGQSRVDHDVAVLAVNLTFAKDIWESSALPSGYLT